MHFYYSTTLVTFLAISSAALLNAAPKSHYHPTTTRELKSSHPTTTSKHKSSHPTTTREHTSSHPTTTREHTSSHPTTTREHTSSHPTTTCEHTSSHPTTTPEPGSYHGPKSGTSAWQPDFSKSKVSEVVGPIVSGKKERVDQMVKIGSNKEIVFNFAKGSLDSDGPGAVAVYSGPTAGGDFGQKATLTYKVKFQDGFKWNKGGKLHGLYGGNLQSQCSGGKFSDDCFSSRIMWRANGTGEAYIYLPNMPEQVKVYCGKNSALCTMGISLERGSFKFIAGKEHTIKMTVALNTPKSRDGTLVVNFDGKDVINRSDIMWTVKDGIKISALFFNSFFGGGDGSWASPQDQSITFTDMSITAN